MTKEYTEQDYLAAVIKGNCKTARLENGQRVFKNVSFKEWKAQQEIKDSFRRILRDRFKPHGDYGDE